MESIASPRGILLTSELRRLDVDPRRLGHAVERGELVRIHCGAYAYAADWEGLDVDAAERYRRRVTAAALASRSAPVLSHQSAAAIWGIPVVGQSMRFVHVLTSLRAGTRTEHGFRRHALEVSDDDIVVRDGVHVTSLRRTLVDLARETTFASAVAGIDWSVRTSRASRPPHVRIDELQDYFAGLPGTWHRRRVHRALEFASPLAESPGESVSRAVIHELGFPAPTLQFDVRDAHGLAGTSDFGWPDFRLLGEFDGRVKYTRGMARPGENVEDIVVREKLREDRMRATGRGMVRWLWSDALQPAVLHEKLLRAGLPVRVSGRSRRFPGGTSGP